MDIGSGFTRSSNRELINSGTRPQQGPASIQGYGPWRTLFGNFLNDIVGKWPGLEHSMLRDETLLSRNTLNGIVSRQTWDH